ncbi:MAG: hypothetical protein MJA84_17235, partial [Firmicutes bacterium]|nr:hypothetical protein [Bacillota bacterium]
MHGHQHPDRHLVETNGEREKRVKRLARPLGGQHDEAGANAQAHAAKAEQSPNRPQVEPPAARPTRSRRLARRRRIASRPPAHHTWQPQDQAERQHRQTRRRPKRHSQAKRAGQVTGGDRARELAQPREEEDRRE